MDALSSLATISPLAAPAATTAVAADRATTVEASTASPQASVQTIFSQFARQLLAQQTTSATQGINDALARNLLSPTLSYVAGGQLYTSAGLLQQYASLQFLSQLSTQPDDSDSGTTIETPGFSFFGSNSSQSINNILNAYQQVSLLDGLGLSLFGTNQDSGVTGTDTAVPKPVVRAASPANNAATNTSIETTA
jgi:hypothetical protein